MKWFHKHLNLTALITTACAWLFAWGAVKLFLQVTGRYYVPFPGQPYIHPDPPLTDFMSFNFQTVTDVATLCSLPVFYWILRRKNHSFMYLLWFLAALIPVPYEALLLVFLLPFWLAGLVLLMLLRNKTPIVERTART